MPNFKMVSGKKQGGGFWGYALIGAGVVFGGMALLAIVDYAQNATGFTVLNTSGFGSSLSQAQLAGTTPVSTSELLGAAQYGYQSATLNWDFRGGQGDSITGTYYIWDAEPANWLNEALISNDYDDGAPTTGSVAADTGLAVTLKTKTPIEYEGAVPIVEEKPYWVHATLSGYEDFFFLLNLGNAGAFDQVTPSLEMGTINKYHYDTTDWESSALDLGVDTNYTTSDHVYKKSLSYSVADYNVAAARRVYFDEIEKVGDGVENITVTLNGTELVIYDDSDGVDLTSYDGNTFYYDWIADNAEQIIFSTDDEVSLKVSVEGNYAVSTVVNGDGFISNGEQVMKITAYDPEGSTLYDQYVTG